MTFRLAYDEITLEHGGNTVRLRPSLRAASQLERLHDGFAGLFRRVAEFHVGTIRDIVLKAATDRREAMAFLRSIDDAPLHAYQQTAQAPVADLCLAFIPAGDPDQPPSPNAKPMPWPDVYRELFRTATGWLGWSPDHAWNATPSEINEAFAAHVVMLKAIHGGTDDKTQSKTIDPDQAARNIADGLDPEFDRAGLRALKANHARNRR